MSRPIMLGVPVFREDRIMVEGAIRSFLDPIVDVVVVDNDASEEAKAGITVFDGAVEIIRNPTNVYVNPAWNQIAKRFLSSDAEILVVANADVLVRPGWAETLLARRERGANELWFGRRTTDPQEAMAPKHHSSESIDGVLASRGGFFAMARKAVTMAFPIPSELRIFYGDDWIFGILGRIGYRQTTLVDVVVWHEESVSQNRLPELYSVIQQDRYAWDTHLGHRSRREADAIVRGGHLDTIEARYLALRDTASDFNEHLPILRSYAERVPRVTEFGVGRSSWALLHARPERLRCYDLGDDLRQVGMRELVALGREIGIDAKFIIGNTLEVEIEDTDLLFIDSLHTYSQLTQELARHAGRVFRYILLHDTETFGPTGEDGLQPGLIGAVEDFLAKDHTWRMRDRLKNNNGLTILERP
jgi:Glycosyl transferase family 2